MLEKDKRIQDYYSKNTIIKDAESYHDKVEVSNEELLEFILGDYDHPRGGEFVVYRYEDRKKKTFLNRLNMLWVYPLFIITIPAQYLILGDWGINRNSKVGKIVGKLVGWKY